MEQPSWRARDAFSLVEMIAVLFIVSVIIIILTYFSVNSYNKYQERLAVNELISEIYYVQTQSLNSGEQEIEFFDRKSTYKLGRNWKKISKEGRFLLKNDSIVLRYRKGNLVSKAATIKIKFEESSYKIIVHLDSGYVTVDEK